MRIAAPLTDLLWGKPSSIQFSIAKIKTFQELEDRLILAPVLKVYNPELPTRVKLHASKLPVGAILEKQYKNSWHPIEYFSKHLNDAESKYCATEWEVLGCSLALQHWRQYLIGKQFDVLTDHAPNQYILSQQKLSRRQVRWVEVLAEYAANFIYKPDSIHSAPDVLPLIPALNSIGKPQSQLEAVRQVQKNSTDQEFLQIKCSANNPTSEFSIN